MQIPHKGINTFLGKRCFTNSMPAALLYYKCYAMPVLYVAKHMGIW